MAAVVSNDDSGEVVMAKSMSVLVRQDAYYDDALAMSNAEARDRKNAGPDKSQANLTLMFDHYGGKGADQMDFDATAAYCKDLSLDLEDVVFFALAELTHAPKMGYFDRKPWIDGWKRVRKDSIDTQKAHIQSIKRQLSEDPEYYKQVYGFCFAYAKEESQKSLSLDLASAIWPGLLQAAPPSMFASDSAFHPQNPEQQQAYLGAWLDFLRTEKNGRSISKDVWSNFVEFIGTADPKFEKYDLDAAWPSLIDEYVEHCKAKLARGEQIKAADSMDE
ncbi:Scaffold-type E3 ligase [Cystobasidiomycetes sp. EMM_F5]